MMTEPCPLTASRHNPIAQIEPAAARPGRLRAMLLAAALAGAPMLAMPQGAEASSRGAETRAQAQARTAQARPAQPRAARPAPRQAGRTQDARTSRHVRTPQRTTPRRTHTAGLRLPDSPRELLPVVIAPGTQGAMFQGSPRAACLEATRRAEQIHGLPPGLLTALALSESGLHAYALNIGGRAVVPASYEAAAALMRAAAPRRSVMAGCLQVNARVHARGDVWPLDARLAADWAGGLLARWAAEHNWEEAMRRWHGASHRNLPRLLCRVRSKLDVVQPDSELFNDRACDEGRGARARRSGEANFDRAGQQSL